MNTTYNAAAITDTTVNCEDFVTNLLEAALTAISVMDITAVLEAPAGDMRSEGPVYAR